MLRAYFQANPATGPWVARLDHKPGWVLKLSLAAAAVVVLVPLALLLVLGAIVGITVFIGLGFIALLVNIARGVLGGLGPRGDGWGPGDDGRRNVRVIPPQQ